MAKRSNKIVSLGLAVFVAGAFATWLVVRDGSTGASAAGGTKVAVLYADHDIAAGTRGEDALNKKLVKAKSVDAGTKPAAALSASSELLGKTAGFNIARGQILTADQFQLAQTRIGTVKIPAGKTALALQLANVPGVAGFVGAGDKIDVFSVVKPGPNNGGGVHLVGQGIDVLNVNGTTLVPEQGQPQGSGLVFLVAVTPAQAERLVYLTSFEQLYFSLVSKDEPTSPATPGSAPADALKLLP